jgi:hypothetical protein
MQITKEATQKANNFLVEIFSLFTLHSYHFARIPKYFVHGSLLDFLSQQRTPLAWRQRLQFASDYLAIILLLHAGPMGTRVMCDANSVEKLFSQLLVCSLSLCTVCIRGRKRKKKEMKRKNHG